MKLLALRCPVCAQPLLPDKDETIVMSCGECFTAVSITEQGINPTTIQFAAPTTEAVSHWLPFWIFNARVQLSERKTQGGKKSIREAAAHFWATSRRLFVPAWEIPLAQAREMGGVLVKKQPQFQPVDPLPETVIKAATVTSDDALKLLEFVILSLEAQRQDWLKSIQFQIDVSKTTLWALPAERQGENNWKILAQEI